jgi:hypothetical protein
VIPGFDYACEPPHQITKGFAFAVTQPASLGCVEDHLARLKILIFSKTTSTDSSSGVDEGKAP